jgi:DNA-binding NarL/FixJ family response regulator
MSATPTLLISDGWKETEEAVRVAGYSGYIGPGCRANQLDSAIQAILEGAFFYHPGFTDQPAIGPLTPRHIEVLYYLGLGYTDQEMAAKLKISEPTVRYHLEKLCQKLKVERRGELSAMAALGGLYRPTTRHAAH